MNAPEVGPLFLDAAEEFIRINVRGMGAVGLQLSGTFVGTVSFECLVDGEAAMVALNMLPPNSATAASSATAAGVWVANVAGLETVQIRVSAYTSGTIRAKLIACAASGRY